MLGIGLAISAAIAVAGLSGYRVNMTSSYPPGLWKIEQRQEGYGVGDIVFICPPDIDAFRVARVRGYLPRGLCPGRHAPLIKRIAAGRGQDVRIADHVSIDGVPIEHSSVRTYDAIGRPMMSSSSGRVPFDHVFLLSSHPASFDSRYFGPLPSAGILGLAIPVLTYAP